MNYSLSYLSDMKGKKTSVVVPIKVWEKITSENEMLQNKLNVFDSIIKGLEEVRDIKPNSIKPDKLEDFLNENGN